ncbi:hypothetical protein CH256_11575, partial [Rhodococcus sp. 05-2254-6]
AAGCSIVLKPSELTPLTTLRLARLATEAGVPDGVFNVVTGTGVDAGVALSSHAGLDLMTFTGSTPVGHACLGGQARQPQGGQRREFTGLEHDGTPGRQRRYRFPHRHLQRIVPRSDRPDHSDRVPADGGGVLTRVLRSSLAVQVPRRPGEELDVVDAARNIEFGCQPCRFAGLHHFLGHEVLRVGRNETRQFHQHGAAVRGGSGGPCRKS